MAPSPANDASRDNIDTGLCEECGQTFVVDVETEVGDEQQGLGKFANGVSGWAYC